jgi:8-oxo-dGTP pyrophosphatase MutT (NUDIX family)
MSAQRVVAEVREAATVLLLREPPEGEVDRAPRIYMLRRSARSAFMPDTLVFPGGRVEHIDLDGDGKTDDAAFEAAAKRETLEECGVELGERELIWFDTWKTPSGESPRRYLARFYFAKLQAHEGAEAQADGEETHDGRWATARQHLDAWDRGEVDLPPPTLSILLRLESHGPEGFVIEDPAELETPILPKVAAEEGTVAILLPHDHMYAETEGDEAPCPARAHHYPKRFLRRDERWQPPR